MITDKKKDEVKAPVAMQFVIATPPVVIPDDIVGKSVKHKFFGTGVIKAIERTAIIVEFDKVGLKKMGYEFCVNSRLL